MEDAAVHIAGELSTWPDKDGMAAIFRKVGLPDFQIRQTVQSLLRKRRERQMSDKPPYLVTGRLGDVLALIQVLALDEHAHRSEDGLSSELQGNPRSAASWPVVAQAHPEFFRVKSDGEHRVSLIARHVTPRDQIGRRPLAPDYTSTLLQLAVELHDREVRRSQSWHVWLPILGVVLGGTLTLAGVWLKSKLGGP